MEDRIDLVASISPKGIDRSRFMQDREISSQPVVHEVWIKEKLDEAKPGSNQVILSARLISYVQGPRTGSPGHPPEQWDRYDLTQLNGGIYSGPGHRAAKEQPPVSTRPHHAATHDEPPRYRLPLSGAPAPAPPLPTPSRGAAAADSKADQQQPRSGAFCLLPGMPDRPPPAPSERLTGPATRPMARTALDPDRDRVVRTAAPAGSGGGGQSEPLTAALLQCVLDPDAAPDRLRLKVPTPPSPCSSMGSLNPALLRSLTSSSLAPSLACSLLRFTPSPYPSSHCRSFSRSLPRLLPGPSSLRPSLHPSVDPSFRPALPCSVPPSSVAPSVPLLSCPIRPWLPRSDPPSLSPSMKR